MEGLPCNHRADMLQVVNQAGDNLAARGKRKTKAQLSQKMLAHLMYTAQTPNHCKAFMMLKSDIRNNCLPPWR